MGDHGIRYHVPWWDYDGYDDDRYEDWRYQSRRSNQNHFRRYQEALHRTGCVVLALASLELELPNPTNF